MKRLLLALALSGFCVGVQAEPALSCDEVDEVGEALTAIGIALEDEQMPIGEGSPEDAALGEITVGLADIAEAENDEDLANASLGMANAWASNDRDAFTDSLAEAVAKLVAHGRNGVRGGDGRDPLIHGQPIVDVLDVGIGDVGAHGKVERRC